MTAKDYPIDPIMLLSVLNTHLEITLLLWIFSVKKSV